jgi:hypothetical protein
VKFAGNNKKVTFVPPLDERKVIDQ